MRRRLIFTNVILLLISLAVCLGVSLYISRRNVVSNSKRNLKNYSTSVYKDLTTNGMIEYDKYQVIVQSLEVIE